MQNRKNIYSYILFFIWPFSALLTQIGRNKISYGVVFLFTLYTSLTITTVTKTSDLVKQIRRYETLRSTDISFSDFVSTLYDSRVYTGYKNFDIVESSLWFFLGKLDADYLYLQLAMGFLLGLFFVLNLKMIESYVRHPNIRYITLIVVSFIFIKPFWLLSGFRFHLASMIAINGILLLLLEKRKALGLGVFMLAPLAHFGYLFFVPIFFGIYLFRKPSTLALAVGVTLNLANASSLLISYNSYVKDYAPEGLYEEARYYIDDDHISHRQEFKNAGKNFHAAYYNEFSHYFILGVGILMLLTVSSFMSKENVYLWNMVLIASGIIAFISAVGGGQRFIVIERILFLIAIITTFRTVIVNSIASNKLSLYMRLFSPLFFFWLIVEIRKAFDFFSLATVIGNPFSFYYLTDIALIELIKW